MLRKTAETLLLSNKLSIAQFLHTSYQANKKINLYQPISDQSEIKTDPKKIETLSQLHQRFKCSIKEASNLYDILKFPEQNLSDISLKKAWLTRRGASLSIIRVNCEILLYTSENLEKRFDALKGVHWKNTDDFLPLLMMDEEVIFKLRRIGPPKCFIRRIYELSEKLKVKPHIISRSCVKHPFIFDLSENLFRRKLELVLNHPIASEAILRDLDIFRRSEEKLEKRFAILCKNNIHRILPWMLKSSDEIIERMIIIRSNQTETENETLDHLAEWLDLKVNKARRLLRKHTALTTLGVKELKKRMDFLLELIEPEVITENIQLLLLPIDMLKDRTEEVKSLSLQRKSSKS